MHHLVETVIAGSLAGLIVDITLFPLDTFKTWRQRKNNYSFFSRKKRNYLNANRLFYKNFCHCNYSLHSLYRGLAGMAVGSMPSFYETVHSIMHNNVHTRINKTFYKKESDPLKKSSNQPLNNQLKNYSESKFLVLYSATAACLGEFAACFVRVPTELVKQRTQAGQYRSSWEALSCILNGRSGEFYRSYTSIVVRDILFSTFQFPLWEILKQKMTKIYSSNNETIPSDALASRNKSWLSNTFTQSIISGSIAGGISAALTTPLDVVKTRIMLNETKYGWIKCIYRIVKEEGIHVLFKGIAFRVAWISLGGALFLGTYDGVRHLIHNLSN
ncbi:hypothetical protein PMAC_001931 [Pneumocystis sp. 'macacae']|nr:hypothetical protein PMAC_001931 [Pneumocystis sp. 'macacae']